MKRRRNWPLVACVALAAAAALLAGARLAVRPPAPEGPAPAYMPPSPENALLMARLRVKTRVTRDVAAGRVSLTEAAAVFRELDVRGPPPLRPVRDVFPDARSEEEAYCRCVIAWAANTAPPGGAAELTRRLEAELDGLLRAGPVRLPTPPAPLLAGGD